MNSFKYQVNLVSNKYFIPDNQDMPERRYDLDWLRILVFFLLIFYHIGMIYVANWGYHFKSEYQSYFLANFMLLISPWRMAVLWLISGVAIRFLLVKVSLWRYISMRSLRLLLPLLFGILVVVPPQLFVEMTVNGDLKLSYWQFYQVFFSSDSEIFAKYQSGIWPHVDVNHLWYLRSLWQYSLGLFVLLPLLNATLLTKSVNWLLKLHGALAVAIVILPIFAIQLISEGDTTREVLGFTFLLYGYLLGWNRLFWQKIYDNSNLLLKSAVYGSIIFLCCYQLIWLNETVKDNEILQLMALLSYSSMRILGLLAVLACSYKYLNRKSKFLSYLNDAVYPFYILHQTIIVVAAYWLSLHKTGAILEPILVIGITISGCFIGFEIIRRNELLRPFFGLKMRRTHSTVVQRASYIAAVLLIGPIAWEILN